MASKITLNRTFHPNARRISFLASGVTTAFESYKAKSYGAERDSLKTLYENRKKCYQWLKHHQIEIGLTSDAPDRSKMLLAIHEKGSPINDIPARPFLKMALVEAESEIDKYMEMACQKASDGDFTGTEQYFKAAGQAGVNAIRAKVFSRIPPPNAPITLHGGWMRSKKTGKPFYVKGKSGDIPLINTGAFLNSFSYKIVYRK